MDGHNQTTTRQLVNPAKLYDRDHQTILLTEAYSRCCRQQERPSLNQREVVFISGPSGVGKTVLAMELKAMVEADGGYFVKGKFDQLAAKYHATSKSYGPFVAAFTEYSQQVIAAGDRRLFAVKQQLQEFLSAVELAVLQDSIPELSKILGTPTFSCSKRPFEGGVSRGVDAESRFVNILCQFVTAISSGRQPPLVLFLDDIQWANTKSLELLKALAKAERGIGDSNLMIICTFRDDEVSEQADLSFSIREIETQGVMLTSIPVTSISANAVNEMIADVLKTSLDHCKSLADTIYSKTNGNVFFVQQLLRTLQEDRLLKVDDTGSWEWDEKEVIDAMGAESVLELLGEKVEQLPERAKEVLKIAACLGIAFEKSVLWAVGFVDRAEVTYVLDLAEKRGLVVVDRDAGKTRFVHDKVQQAVYSLISDEDRAAFHLNIGRKLFPCLPPNVMDDHLLLVADQITRGIHLVDDQEEKMEYAELYLRAGQKAAMSSAFSSSAAFLSLGIGQLNERSWETNYRLTLKLHNTAAEIEYYNGNFHQVDTLANEVFKHGRKFEDCLKAHFTRIYSLGSRGEMHACVEEGFKVLELLGEKFPRNPTRLNAKVAFLRCRHLLHGKRDSDILSLPIMQENQKLMALRLIVVIAFFANSVRKESAPLLSVRIITLTMHYGMNDMCCAGFASLSLVHACREDLKQADRFGNLALQIFNKYDSKEWQARVGGNVYGGVYPMKHPYRESLKPLLAAHRSGLILGDIHFAMVCSYLYSAVSVCTGANLCNLAQEATVFRELCLRYRLHTALATTSTVLQLMANFMGQANDPLVLTGEFLNEAQALKNTKGKHPVAYMLLLLYKHTLAVYMNDFPAALNMSALIQSAAMDNIFPFLVSTFSFLDGLVSASMSRSSKQHKSRAKRLLVKLRAYAEHCPQNFSGKVYLVEAEMALAAGDSENALILYKDAMEWARRQELIHDEALAYERAGYALCAHCKPNEGREYLKEAMALYASWGAQAKVDQLSKDS